MLGADARQEIPRTVRKPAGPRAPRSVSPPNFRPVEEAQSQLPLAFVQSSATPYESVRVPPAGPSGTLRGTLSRGTVIHRGFYDLLDMIPNTASSLRTWNQPGDNTIAGPRYEHITSSEPVNQPPKPREPLPPPSSTRSRGIFETISTFLPDPQSNTLTSSFTAYFSPPNPSPAQPTSPKKVRRVSKDMISSPTGFMYVFLSL